MTKQRICARSMEEATCERNGRQRRRIQVGEDVMPYLVWNVGRVDARSRGFECRGELREFVHEKSRGEQSNEYDAVEHGGQSL